MTADRPTTEPRTDYTTQAGIDLLDVIGEVLGYPVFDDPEWHRRIDAIESAAYRKGLIDAAAESSPDPVWDDIYGDNGTAQVAAPRAEGQRVCWSCEGEHDEMKHSLTAPRAEGLDVERLAAASPWHVERDVWGANMHWDRMYDFGSIHEHRCLEWARAIAEKDRDNIARLSRPSEGAAPRAGDDGCGHGADCPCRTCQLEAEAEDATWD